MKKLIFLIFSVFLFFFANAQKKQNVYFFKENGREVIALDYADYIRIIQEPDSGELNYVFQEYHKNGKPKTLGKVSSFEPNLLFEDVLIRYNSNGKKISAISYKKGEKLGMAFYYFANGIIKKQIEYLEEKNQKSIEIKNKDPFSNLPLKEQESRLLYQADSLGKVLVKEGNGYLIDTSLVLDDRLVEEGNYKDGYKDGVWKGVFLSGQASFKELYENNTLVNGESISEGHTYPYTITAEPPKYKGGIDKFYAYLGNSIKYPIDAAESHITGNVLIRFAIEKDGKVGDTEILRSLSSSIDMEATRVVKAAKDWIGGKHRGIAVKVKYTIPISFSLR